MSHVDFKKCQCRISLSLNIPPVPCQIFKMSLVNVVKGYVTLLNLRNGHVALLILGVYFHIMKFTRGSHSTHLTASVEMLRAS